MAVNIFPGTYTIGSAVSASGHRGTLTIGANTKNDLGVLQYRYEYKRDTLLFFDLTSTNKAVAVTGYPQGNLALQYVLGITPFTEQEIQALSDPCNASTNKFSVELTTTCSTGSVKLEMKGLVLVANTGSMATTQGYLAESMVFLYSGHEYTRSTT